MPGLNVDESFGDIQQRFFPGSRTPIPDRTVEAPKKRKVPVDVDAWDAHPRTFSVRGQLMEFFTIGALAKALNRETGTIRLWERQGVLPRARYQVPVVAGKGKQRLYTRAQIEGIVWIAGEEGMLTTRPRAHADTKFVGRVQQLFARLAQEQG